MLKDVLSSIKGRMLPPSSRSFHTFAVDISSRIGDLAARQCELLDRQREVFERLDRLENEAREAKVRDAHARIYLEAIHRRDGESADDARRRMFASIPEATGAMRLHQLANARLMSELDRICSELGIEYWFAYATLVGALSRDGFIPWDDDIDICIMRDDIEKLKAYLEGDPDYQVSVVFDRFVLCRQVRFSSTDPLIPCFIDLSIWDYATDASKEHDDALRKMRLDLMSELSGIDSYDGYWADQPYLYEPGSGEVVQALNTCPPDGQDPQQAREAIRQIESVFGKFQAEAYEQGIYCDANDANAFAYALDNIYDRPRRRILWEKGLMLPTHRHAFEGYAFKVPHEAEAVAEGCLPGYPYLPDDIYAHTHFSHDALDADGLREALERFAAGQSAKASGA